MVKVMVVDDSGLARRTVRRILETAGHDVVEAEDGLIALERYFTEKPSVVLLDVTMREMDGIEVLTRLRELDPTAAVIIVSADIQSSTREMAHAGGAAQFVTKPVSASDLLAAIEAVVAGGEPCI